MGKNEAWGCNDPLNEPLAADLWPYPRHGRMARTRSIGFLQAVIAMLALLLGLVSVIAPTSELIGWALLLVYFAAPPAFLARRIALSLDAQGQPLSLADRIAAFLCVSLFTVPFCFVGLIVFAVVIGFE
jgi:hypothetical protein